MRYINSTSSELVSGSNGRAYEIWIKAGKLLIAAAWMLVATAWAAQAVPIRDLTNLTSVQVLEASGGVTVFNMLPTGSVITTRLADRLTRANSDYASNANEFYDFFYSDADGTFNTNGAFLSVTAIFDNMTDSGLNVTGARLVFVIPQVAQVLEYASFVSSFVAVGTLPFPGTMDNALGDTPTTTTFLGDTVGQPDPVRLRITLGFESSRPPTTISEPGTLALFGIGLAGIGVARRRRKIRQVNYPD
jgi:PEP-CTERM motif